MELIGFIQVFNIIVIAIGTLLYMFGRSLTFSSSTSSSSGAADAAVEDNNDDDDVAIPPLPEKYDVFLSFRGEDTRPTFTSHLRAALERKKFETYIDDKLKPGDEIGPTLLKAIEKSRLSVIIFSKNYASSTWCLSELVHILKCRKQKGQMVVPIFYDINPSGVRKQEGSYADAFAQLEKRFKDGMGKVREWRKALRTAANLSGFDYSNNKGTEAGLIEKLVEDISTKLKRETSYDLKGMVGIQGRIEQVESLLSNNDWQGVYTVGIWGMGGIGKTTLANAVFKRLSSKFQACCFLSNVREKAEQTDGVHQLEKTLLREILREENLSLDSTSVRNRLSRTKVLIVFDDVSNSSQIKDLAGDNLRYGDGSRIMVTSRERSVLMKAVRDKKDLYKVEKLKTDDALRLFQFNAFKDNSPSAEYRELLEKVVKYAGGIPLALEILGSLFFECESKDQWEDALSTLTNYPNKKIQNTFRVSYDRLERNAQEVFLDIACFYKGDDIEYVKKMVDYGQLHGGKMVDNDQMRGGSSAADGIRVLLDRSLILIDPELGTIDMHDLVQEMGWTIVREQCIEEPGERNRLFIAEDVYHVLENKKGTKKVQAIFFNRSNIGSEQNLDRADFEKMYNLRLLKVNNFRLYLENSLSLPNSLRYLSWEGYPLKSLPQEFSLKNLVELDMPNSEVEQLWNGGQNPMNLKVIKLRYSKCLTALPNLLGSPNIEHIDLFACEGLVKIPQYLKKLDKLTYLNLAWCPSLNYLPDMPSNIESLRLQGSGIKELPSSVWSHENISSMDIRYCRALKKLPSSSCMLKVSGAFSLEGGNSLGEFWELPRGIDELDLSSTAIEVLPTSSLECLFCLTTLKLKDCKNLASLPPDICELKSLEVLDLTGCSELKDVPSSIYKITNLKTLSFYDCSKLQNFPHPAGSVGLLSLEVLNLGQSGILEIPENLICSTSLRDINLRRTKIRSVPLGIKQASQLSCLCLIECMSLESLPELPVLSRLEADGCESLMTVSSSITAITQCWNRYELLREQLYFSNCHRLGYNARSSIMFDALLRIMRVATAASKLKEEEEDYGKFKEEEDYEKFSEPLVTIVCPGSGIPFWFGHQIEGASITVKLPANWFCEGFLGFALSVVASSINVKQRVRFGCNYIFKTKEGGSHEINCFFNSPWEDGQYRCESEKKHVFVLYKDLEYEEGAKWSSDFYHRVTEVSVFFHRDTHYMIEKCGICLLYNEDAKKLKFVIGSRQERDESEEASGRDESDYSNIKGTDVLSTLRNYPTEEIQNTLRVSYNELGTKVQELFLDIACFYRGKPIKYVKKMVEMGQMHGGLCAADGIRVLCDRSLIWIDPELGTIYMPDFVQETGWTIVYEQCIIEPGKRSRLFNAEDVYHVLENNTGTEKVQAISFNWLRIGEQNLDRADFKNMYNLRLLRVGNPSLYSGYNSYSRVYRSRNLTLSLPNSLRYLLWEKYPLKSLPPEFSLENLVELHMPCSRLKRLWDGGQNPINLKVIVLRSCESLTALPNLLGSPNIEHMDLSGCKRLVKIPQHLKNLDKLTCLDLSWCKCLKYLPEMPRNIESLHLQGSGIKELPSSVWSHEKISSLDIRHCKKLKELPSNTCKLKVSGAFSLYGCVSLEKVWELPRGIGVLDLSRQTIKVLPTSSMGCLFCLTTLKLKDCKNLASLPPDIGELKSLEVLDLTGCSKLQDVPSSIYKLTNIKTLSFSKCGKLQNFPQPTGSVGFLSLEVLNLKYSGILEIPEGVICSTSLRDINLEGTQIQSIPSSIKQASQLSCLCLIGCKSLQSLPELPMLSHLQANGCKSLKTVSSSRTAITQRWNRNELLREQLDFSDCPRLGDDARSSIMVDAQLRIMRVATAASKLKEEEDYDEYFGPLVTVVCSGYEIPNWFVHQNEGASINVTLPANWFREGFLGFALSVVIAKAFVYRLLGFQCKYTCTFKTEAGESHEMDCLYEFWHSIRSNNVCVLYKDLEYEVGAKWWSAFCNRVTEVSVHFELKPFFDHERVKKCGICLLYAEDARKLKFDVMSLQEQDEPAARRSGDP